MSEEMVVRQAAPTLAGIKTGSLFPCPCAEKDVLLGEIRAFNRHYLSRGLCLLPLRFTEGKALLYLYRPAALRRDLRGQTAEALLADAGYPCGSCGGCAAGRWWGFLAQVPTAATAAARSSSPSLPPTGCRITRRKPCCP